MFEQNHPGPSEQALTELTGSRDPCRHARREPDRIEIPNDVADNIEVDVELVLTTSGSSGGQYEGHTVYRVKLRDETPSNRRHTRRTE